MIVRLKIGTLLCCRGDSTGAIVNSGEIPHQTCEAGNRDRGILSITKKNFRKRHVDEK